MSITVDVHLDNVDWGPALRADVLDGLTRHPKELPPKWFYDKRGSELFDQITRLPEYYPTGAERQILTDRAAEIARLSGADTLVELGSGTSDKSRVLLSGMAAAGALVRYIPFDVSEATLRDAAAALADEYDGLEVHAVVGDFDHHLELIPRQGKRLVAFLGSTIGNFEPDARVDFLRRLAATMNPGDDLLLGVDLVKDPHRLVLAYDDPTGVTAAFNKNVLVVVNRELGADFDLGAFDHEAVYEPDAEWIEMRLRSRDRQRVFIDALDLTVDFAAGEAMRTEISAKFRRDGIESELGDAGLTPTGWWTDRPGDFALVLARRQG
ncbi:MAG: L-histidine N(alpha)-methyltransferase [Acidimicrobiia bacterium]|nr:L-histidine N(alpha)-methyltransferase [Acidimicrobiia bacterium]